MKYTYEFVKNYIEKFNYILLSNEYLGCNYKLYIMCQFKHDFKMTFSSFKRGIRCPKCSNCKKFTYNEVNDILKNKKFKLISKEYKNVKSKLIIKCDKNHKFNISFESIRKGRGCPKCSNIEKSIKFKSENNPNWNNNRDEIPIKRRIRKTFTKNWIITNMKNDKNYINYINNPNLYCIDHKIPIDIMSKLIIKHNLDEEHIKEVVNDVDNLQLLTRIENRKKWYTGSILEAVEYIQSKGVKL